jgi:DNA-binding transcriptional ArsR family regulator
LYVIHVAERDITRLRILPTLGSRAFLEFPDIQVLLDADRALRAQTMLTHGLTGLLTTLHPDVRWAPPILYVLDGTDVDTHLDGCRLVLAPSLSLRRPAVLFDASGGCVLAYPVDTTAGDSPAPELTRLLGYTRATLLSAIGDGITGSAELGRRAAVSRTAVSRHARLLREAGLVVTLQYGPVVRHTLTERGSVLLGRTDLIVDTS